MRIGLTFTGWEDKQANYVKWLKGEGPASEDIEVIRLSVADGNLDVIGSCDGLVLSGGVDVDPVYYGGSLEYEQAPRAGWEKERDDFEAVLLKEALNKKIPVLGICRGLQLINVCCKGTLLQDLGPEGDASHQNRGDVDEQHPVWIEEGSLLYAIAGKGGEANSAHHQAIDRPGEGLRVNCYAEDGTIEGIEWKEPAGKSFLLAVQWHPERMFTNGLAATSLYKNIRERFINEIKQSKKVQ